MAGLISNIFYILDIFAEEKYTGNQLAVVIVKNPLSDAEMQRITREFNFSETTFILSDKPENGGYNVRIFTPEREVPFAGHPTLGTAYVIQKEVIKNTVDTVILNLKAGQIPVKLDYKNDGIERLTMKQMEPVFGRTFDREQISTVLNLDKSDIDERFLVEEVSTGLPFIIVPLKALDAVKKARIDKKKYFELIKDMDAKAIFIFCPETYKKENHLNARMFADYYGIPEDPATGSANGCLAGYLVEHNYFGRDHINIRVEQGYEIGRPSLLFLEAKKKGDKIEVFVGGRVIEVAKGVLL
ncbi:MAG: PhzF family phenazine biosynthesis protein [Nitrospirae bacterium]|nr:PhzF family phenazine biosynthesis protein [Nitrospirota bacterium]